MILPYILILLQHFRKLSFFISSLSWSRSHFFRSWSRLIPTVSATLHPGASQKNFATLGHIPKQYSTHSPEQLGTDIQWYHPTGVNIYYAYLPHEKTLPSSAMTMQKAELEPVDKLTMGIPCTDIKQTVSQTHNSTRNIISTYINIPRHNYELQVPPLARQGALGTTGCSATWPDHWTSGQHPEQKTKKL